MLSNIYLHYVLDKWFIECIGPLLEANSKIIRFSDDFLLLFNNKSDAKRIMKVLPKCLGKYGLSLHPEKPSLIKLTNGEG
ncbi:MAG TPA: reverse transcriptase domain-containing protein [Fodinibius sp.]|nr:reverse transcriptase domain-containing protein [Fodinibius sp.]